MNRIPALLMVLGALPALADGPPPEPAPPRGLFAVLKWNGTPEEASPLWTHPDVDGLVVRTYWRDLNPAPETCRWDYLDALFAKALEAGLKIHLVVAPGFYAPDWVLEDPRIRTAVFEVPQGPAKGERRPLPLPWDDAYLSHWFGFVDRLAARYGTHPALGYVSVTGPNSHNGEVALPREGAGDEAAWLALVDGRDRAGKVARLEGLMRDAWIKAIDRFCRDFPGRRVTIALVLRSLPLEKEKDLQQAYEAALVRHGVREHPGTFGVQSNGLNAKGTLPHWKLIEENAGKVFTAFQTRAPGNLYPDGKREDAGDREAVFRKAVLEQGLSRRVDVIEIYDSDFLDPALAKAVHEAHEALAAGPSR